MRAVVSLINLHMISREDIQKKYSGLSTNELLAIVRDEEGYTETAIFVANEELQKRNVTEDQLHEFEERTKQSNAIILQKVSAELSIFQKCFFYFIWVPLLHFPIKQNLREDGFVLKVRQAGYYSLAGFVCLILTALFSILLNLSDMLSVLTWVILILPVFALDNYSKKNPQSL